MKYNFPRLSDSKEFERLSQDYCIRRYGESFELYGRPGQKQYGVDIINCNSDKHMQAKDYIATKEDIDAILTKYQLPEGKCFIIAANGNRDTKIQDYIGELNKERRVKIEILFWDNFEEALSYDKELRERYFPNYTKKHL